MSLTGTSLYSDSSLVSYWKLDGNSIDSKGTTNGVDTSMSYAAGKFETAAVFNGSSSYITLGTADVLNLGTGAFSMSCWIKTSYSGTAYDQIIFRRDNEQDAASIRRILGFVFNPNSANAGKIGFGTWANSVENIVYSSVTVNDGNWHHLLGKRDGSTLSLYIDGVLRGSMTDLQHNLTVTSANRLARFGKYQAAAGGYFNGSVDDFAVFNRALTINEVNKIYFSSDKVFNYLVVGGGGGGGYIAGGGGGAGGVLYGTIALTGTSYSITVGDGGLGDTNELGNGANGQNSIFSTLTAIGGGGGGSRGSASPWRATTGANGGSGGGGSSGELGSGVNPIGGTGTSGQGYNGGSGQAVNYGWGGGGGGGASQAGGNSVTLTAGKGGDGILNPITSSGYIAGGGGGASYVAGGGVVGQGGLGGGGIGGSSTVNGGNGTINTGSGGGGCYGTTAGKGGSGLVQIKYTTADLSDKIVGGGTITTSGDYTVHTFTSSGTLTIADAATVIPSIPTLNSATSITHNSFNLAWTVSTDYPAGYYLDVCTDSGFTTFVSGYNNKDIGLVNTTSVSGLQELTTYYVRVRSYNSIGVSDNSNTITVTTAAAPKTIDYLIVAGGGGGGSTTENSDIGGGGGGAGGLLQASNVLLNTGSYSIVVGGGGGSNTNGSNTTFNGLTAIGGGAGGRGFKYGVSGGSGGGCGGITNNTITGGSGTAGQGYAGGNNPTTYYYDGAGGGGAGSAGGNGNAGSAGGVGISSSITGTAILYAVGGRGGSGVTSNGTSGGGGNGGSKYHLNGYNGNAGVVIVRYLTIAFGNCTGGTKTTDGDYTVHTFTSSGTLVLTEPSQAVVNNGFFVFFYD